MGSSIGGFDPDDDSVGHRRYLVQQRQLHRDGPGWDASGSGEPQHYFRLRHAGVSGELEQWRADGQPGGHHHYGRPEHAVEQLGDRNAGEGVWHPASKRHDQVLRADLPYGICAGNNQLD